MKKISIKNKRLLLSQLMWKKHVNQKYLPHAGYMGNGEDIYLVLGFNGTGINRLIRLLSQALPNNQYIHHPLVRFEPKLTLSNQGDRLAIPYHKKLAPDHPLKRVYRMYTEWDSEESNQSVLQPEDEKGEESRLIMKETHGLLATEALIRELKCHVLFYVSDPVILVDQILTREGLDTSYLDLESKAVMDSTFLKRFHLRHIRGVLHAYKLIQRLPSKRQRRVQKKIFTIALIQDMFHKLVVRYPELATVVDFTLIEHDPRCLEFPLVNWLGAKNIDLAKRVLSMATFTQDGHDILRWTRSWPESIATFETLTSEDVRTAYKIIFDHELMRNEGQGKSWTARSAV
jgi:hypothetical protein